jgi:single-strand DNA-binding protein
MSSAAGGDAASRRPGSDGATDRTAPRNEVVLVGRVPAAPEERALPSGDVLVTWRVVVGRPPGRRPPDGVRATTVDTLDCVAWTASARRAATALAPDDVVEVSGALRRRFWRAGGAAASRCEVEVSSVRRVSRRPRAAPRPPEGSSP